MDGPGALSSACPHAPRARATTVPGAAQEITATPERLTLDEEAKKKFFKVPRIQGTIPHPVQGEAAAGVVMLRPAAPGTGVIAGGPVRAVLECAGIHDVLSKSLGSDNAINIVHATVAALQGLERPEEVAARRGLTARAGRSGAPCCVPGRRHREAQARRLVPDGPSEGDPDPFRDRWQAEPA